MGFRTPFRSARWLCSALSFLIFVFIYSQMSSRHILHTIPAAWTPQIIKEYIQVLTEEQALAFSENMAYELSVETSLSVKGSPLSPLSEYTNPCWLSVGGAPRCLPLVYLVGVTKAGTTDLYTSLLAHPDILPPSAKEPMWWNRKYIGSSSPKISFQRYLSLYNGPARIITSRTTSQQVTIEGTPSYLWDYDGWRRIKGNRESRTHEPQYILAQALHVLVPQAKIIAILRQPTERWYSQFRMKYPDESVEVFHHQAVQEIERFNLCLQQYTLRACAYREDFQYGLRASLYYVYLSDWLSVYPRDQVLVIKGEEYYADRASLMEQAFNFLSLDQPSKQVKDRFATRQPKNSREQFNSRIQAPMLHETVVLLDQFFEPYNQKLAQLLGDDKYLWQNYTHSHS